MGLLSRYTADLYNEKIYDITERGSERLHYLRDSVLERMEIDRMNEFLAKIKRCKIEKQRPIRNMHE
jgi:DNA-binding PadR family transcriptional regulator